jgi:peptide/nickel transport system permease protein
MSAGARLELVDRRPLASRRRRWLRRYLLAAAGGAIILFWLVMMLFAPVIAPQGYSEVDLSLQLLPPSMAHLLGTDELGRDVFARIVYGARISLPTGIIVALVGGVLGTLYGGLAAYARGRLEEIMMRVTDLSLCFPPLILAMAIAAGLGIGWTNTMIAMIVVWWPKYARVSRSLVIVQRSLEYVEAARVMGYGSGRILLRHILPNTLGPLITLVTLDIGNAIITFAGLNFLGLGVVPPTPEWGAMVSQGRTLIFQWWVSAFPGLAIFTVVMGFNFLGDGLRDWLDPRAKRR